VPEQLNLGHHCYPWLYLLLSLPRERQCWLVVKVDDAFTSFPLIEKNNDNLQIPLMFKLIKIKIPLTFVNYSEVAAFISLVALAVVFLGTERLPELADVCTHGHTVLNRISCQSKAPM